MQERKHLRNVFVYDHEGNTVASFWQYGLIDWEEFHRILTHILLSEKWAIFVRLEGGKHGGRVPNNSAETVPEGEYVLLTPDEKPLNLIFRDVRARPRNPTASTTESRKSFYRDRTRQRDPYCLITKEPHNDNFSRFDATHIFPQAHSEDWIGGHFSSKITDPAPVNEVGGPSKIDSIQNVMLLRKDLHSSWDNYDFGVNPDRGYIIVPFIRGLDSIAGKILSLDHIQDPNLRPLDDIFRDHFLQGVFKHMKAAGEPSWDYEDTFSPGAFDLSRTDVWGTTEGREQLELALSNRLHSTMVQQQLSQTGQS